jgi:large subunit ribosomal protein L3
MGGNKTTVAKLKIMQIDSSKDLIVLKGSVPGKAGTLLIIKNL